MCDVSDSPNANAGRRACCSKTARVATAILLVTSALIACERPQPDVIAGSAQIECVIRGISNSRVAARTLIPPGLCPGHFDVRPSDIEMAAKSKMVIVHSWQLDMPSVSGLIKSAGLPAERVKVLPIQGNWMIPAVQADAARMLADVLSELDPSMAGDYQQRAKGYADSALRTGATVKGEIEPVSQGLKVISSEMQAGFVKWAGFEVVSTFERPEDLSVADLQRLVEVGKSSGVALIVDNLQSGSVRISEGVVQDTGAEHVVLSNFPGAFPDTETWEKAFRKNVALLVEAARRWRLAHE